MGTSARTPGLAPCSQCGSQIAVPLDARDVACPHCDTPHAVQRLYRGVGPEGLRLLPPGVGEHNDAASHRRGLTTIALGFVGIVLATGFIFGAREGVTSQLLEPVCTTSCDALGLERVGTTHRGSGYKAFWRSPNTCLCRALEHGPPPPTCSRASSVNLACDAGFWFGTGGLLLSALVNGLFGLCLLLPAGVWFTLAWLRGRGRAG